MATGVKPRDEESQLTRADLENIQEAMKNKKFRELFSEYVTEIRDPANQALYQKEMTQLEKERGYDVTFINPKSGYVIKTSVAGDRKAFINICSNENIGKPSYTVQKVKGQKGMNWLLPYTLIPPREDYDQNKKRVVIYDVVFHPDTLRMAEVNKRFREIVNKTAFDGLQKAYNIHLDDNNFRFPKSNYKGMITPAVIRKEDPNYKPPTEEETSDLSPDLIEKMYPQHMYVDKLEEPMREDKGVLKKQQKLSKKVNPEFNHSSENGYTKPKYLIKQQKNIDLQEFTYHKDCKQHSVIPSHIIVEINLPLLSSTKDCILDVNERSLTLVSENPAKYKLNVNLPYSVNDKCGNATFDKTKRMLIITLPVIRKNFISYNSKSSKVDSGVESEENSGSQSDEDTSSTKLIVELPPKVPMTSVVVDTSTTDDQNKDTFLDANLGYVLPQYTYNILDDTIAFTFHVKNTDPDSVKVKKHGNKIYIKFTTIGSGYVPVHYAALVVFDEHIKFANAEGESWDNNVILQLELDGVIPQNFLIGLNENSLTCEHFDVSHIKKANKLKSDEIPENVEKEVASHVEVSNLGSQTNIVVSSNQSDYDEDDVEYSRPQCGTETDTMWTNSDSYENRAKSILRKPIKIMRSYSESSYGDVASSMDYVSSDCIPEESSFKKTVRFNDVIARQFYRYNSSIEGQKKKNQRKKNKKRNQERHKSESEAEDDVFSSNMNSKSKLKSALKPRRDSGLADTSDPEGDSKAADHHSNGTKDTKISLNNTYFNEGILPKSVLSVVENVENEPDPESKNNKVSEKERGNTSDETTVNSLLNVVDNKNENLEPVIWKSDASASDKKSAEIHSKSSKPVTCDNIKHNTDLYNPEKLNKGQYLEVMFKNDLIFDLDM